MDDDFRNKLLDYAFKLLSIRPRSVSEIQGRLKYYCQKKKIPQNAASLVIKQLIDIDLLNDENFARWWIDQRHEFKYKGSKAIQLELIRKGIDREIIDRLLIKEKNSQQEFDLAQKVVLKKIRSLRNLPKIKQKVKISNLLYRRGFEWEIISQVIDSVMQKE